MARRWRVEGRPGWQVHEYRLDGRLIYRVDYLRGIRGEARTWPELERVLHGLGISVDALVEEDESGT
jgi:hypothetical protein